MEADDAALRREAEALERVLFRLASASDERLAAVVRALLPQLLRLFPLALSTPAQLLLRDKVVEVLSHIKTRLRAVPESQLPVPELAAILGEPDRSPFSYSFAFLFLEIGFGAATQEDRTAAIAKVLPVLDRFPAAQHEVFFRLVLRALPLSGGSIWTETKDARSLQNLDILLDFLLDLVLLPEPQAPARPAAETTVFGLTLPRLERLLRCNASNKPREELYTLQLNALKLLKELSVPSRLRLLHFVAGSASYHHAVKAFCEEQISRMLKYEEMELEDADVMRGIASLVLGSQVAQSAGVFTGRDVLMLSNRARAADASILQAIAALSASKTATNMMPMMLQLLCQLMFGAESGRPLVMTNRIKLAGVRLCQWVFLHCDQVYMDGFLGPVLFPTFMRVLMDPHFDSEASSAEFVRDFRQGVYESIALLSSRSPTTVAGSEQAFQVLLVKCLTEEANRSGAGVMAIKAFTALADAYCAENASQEVRKTVTNELISLMNGEKLFDTRQNYTRVRAAIAAWCDKILAIPSNENAVENQKLAIRFALLRFEADSDEQARQQAARALYRAPLPRAGALANYLQAHFNHKDLKKSMAGGALAVERCLRFCMAVMRLSYPVVPDEVESCRVVAEYFAQSLFGDYDSKPASRSLCETAASTLVDFQSLDPDLVGSVISTHVLELVKVSSASVDRRFLMNIAALIKGAVRANTKQEGHANNAVRAATAVLSTLQLSDTEAALTDVVSLNRLCCAPYVLGSALASVSESEFMELPDGAKTALLRAFQAMVELLVKTVEDGSDFVHYPRSDDAQNAKVALIRSALDGIRSAGSMEHYLRSERRSTWCELKGMILKQIVAVIQWNTSSVKADEHLVSKLAAVKRIAVQTMGRSVAGLSGSSLVGGQAEILQSAVHSLLVASKDETDPEFQLDVGEALVAIGTHTPSETFDVQDAFVEPQDFNANRAASVLSTVISDYMESKQIRERRNATIWLMCICAAGLRPVSNDVLSSSSWRCVLGSPSFASAVFKMHEFFVTMLNDSGEITKESAVKGLAYLRIRAPTEWMGEQFSDSLFRRLRCFRAFAAPSAASAVDDPDDDNDSAPNTQAPSNGNATASASTGSTVENAAYREVSNVAADVGDPELMYGLLFLSATDPLWDSIEVPTDANTADAFSFAVTDREFRSHIIAKAAVQAPSVDSDEPMPDASRSLKLLPWLYLLKFHSNSKVSSLMARLWKFFAIGDTSEVSAGSTSSGGASDKAVLKQHWQPMLEFILSRLENSRNFKYREAASAALMDLLNGVSANDVRGDFSRLWRVASRAVDDVMESVALAGVKLYRSLGELSLRLATSDAECRVQLLAFLVRDGITAKNTICRALSLDVLLRLVKELDAVAIQDNLASLIPTLLEYLSSLEMPELQYAQFHVEKKDELERLRVSLSQAGPVGQLLELATARLKQLADTPKCVEIVDELTRFGGGIASLLQFGVGLNTRVGTANFVATLAVELPFELRKCGGADTLLRRVLMPFVRNKTADENERYGDTDGDGDVVADGMAVRAYVRAAAYLCPLAEASNVRVYVRDGIFARSKVVRTLTATSDPLDEAEPSPIKEDDNDEETAIDGRAADASKEAGSSNDISAYYASRFLMISAIATKELVAKVPPTTFETSSSTPNDDWYCSYVFPAAYVGQFAGSETLASTWRLVLDELPPSILYARESVDGALLATSRLLAQPAWDSRAQAVRALSSLFSTTSTYRSKLSQDQSLRVRQDLLAAVPGRLWKGKGAVLEALVVVAGSVLHQNGEPGGDAELSLLLLTECERAWRAHDLAYLESAVASVGALSARLPASHRVENALALRRLLIEWLESSSVAENGGENAASLPPLLLKSVLDAMRLAWPSSVDDVSFAGTSADLIEWLITSIAQPVFNAWSVRRAAFECLSKVLGACPSSSLVLTSDHSLGGSDRVARVVNRCCADFGAGDAKYAVVRVAAAGALTALLQQRSRSKHSPEDPAEAQVNESVALRLVVERENVAEALAALRRSEEPAEQQAAAALASAAHVLLQ